MEKYETQLESIVASAARIAPIMEQQKAPGGQNQGQDLAEDVFRHYGLPEAMRSSIAYGIWENSENGLARATHIHEALCINGSEFQMFAVFRDRKYPFVLSLLIDEREMLADLAAGAIFREKGRF